MGDNNNDKENKNEYEFNIFEGYSILSINNEINSNIDILIESIERFSFCDDEDEENCEKNNKKKRKEKDILNYKKVYNILEDTNLLKKEYDLINLNDLNQLEYYIKKDSEKDDKICGLFTKEDFILDDVENEIINKNLNDSFEFKFNNPISIETEENDKEIILNNNKIYNNNDIIEIPIINTNSNRELKSPRVCNEELYNELNQNRCINNYNKKLLKDNKKNEDSSRNLSNKNKNIKVNSSLDNNRDYYNCIINIKEVKNHHPEISELLSLDRRTLEDNSSLSSTNGTQKDVNAKISELKEKLNKSENNYKIIKDTNEKLLEVINIFNSLTNMDKNKPLHKKCISHNKLLDNQNNSNNNKKLYINNIPPKNISYVDLYCFSKRFTNRIPIKYQQGFIPLSKSSFKKDFNLGYSTTKNLDSKKLKSQIHFEKIYKTQKMLNCTSDDNELYINYNYIFNNKENINNLYNKLNMEYNNNNNDINNINKDEPWNDETKDILDKINNKHKILNYKDFEVIFDEYETTQEKQGNNDLKDDIKNNDHFNPPLTLENNSKNNKNICINNNNCEENKKKSDKLKDNIDDVNNQDKENENKTTDFFKDGEEENENFFEDNLNLNQNKRLSTEEEKIYQKILNKNKSKNEYILPFYLLNKQEMFLTLLNYINTEKIKTNSIFYYKPKKK